MDTDIRSHVDGDSYHSDGTEGWSPDGLAEEYNQRFQELQPKYNYKPGDAGDGSDDPLGTIVEIEVREKVGPRLEAALDTYRSRLRGHGAGDTATAGEAGEWQEEPEPAEAEVPFLSDTFDAAGEWQEEPEPQGAESPFLGMGIEPPLWTRPYMQALYQAQQEEPEPEAEDPGQAYFRDLEDPGVDPRSFAPSEWQDL